MKNRLQHETSPYLLQHAENPVDWYAWGDEAFSAAKAQDKPILLSVGYSSCHWCHVMSHESFEDAETARMMNEWFINVKVDREERPDVDEIYMTAVQAMTGHGGWPMTVFLLANGDPFYGGTYFPLEPRYGMPSFKQALEGVYDAYANRREEVEKSARELTKSLRRDLLGLDNLTDNLNVNLLDIATKKLLSIGDKIEGGFEGAPKFPQPMTLEYLLRSYARNGDQAVLDHVVLTLKKMARGGMYDQLAGGFHRYSVDAVWLVPHFEKMLYDNALLSRVYLHAWQVTGDTYFRRIAEEIYDYVLREMTSPEGGFYSATDADSEGEEGKFFVWSKAELESLLGENATAAIEYWGVTDGGNFEGANILYVPHEEETVAQKLQISVEELRLKLEAARDTLFAERALRVHPMLDDKVITAWNGLMLVSLSEAARVLNRDDYRQAAVRNADFMLENLKTADGRLMRTYNRETAKIDAYLEDYADFISALLELYQTTFDQRYFTEARAFADYVLGHFRAADGGFFDTSDQHDKLIVRPRSLQDNAIPSGNTMFAHDLIRLAAYTGHSDYDEIARATLNPLANAMREFPQAFGEGLCGVDALVMGIDEVAIIGELNADETRALLEVIQKPYRTNVIVAQSSQDVDGDSVIPLLSNRSTQDGQPRAFVCRNLACRMPVTSPDALESLIKRTNA